ncbi:MAG: hypothetical protein EOM19_06275, partial [Candidatus Moranbacteria bacterium]|nr:hypothetical protein [Candidatus Moranbacteria bacterium]
MATPKFDRGHERRIYRAKKLYGENYKERLQVFIDGQSLDPMKKQGSILVIAEAMGLLGRSGLLIRKSTLISREGREAEMFDTNLSPRDLHRFESLFAEHALGERYSTGKHSVFRRLKEMCHE